MLGIEPPDMRPKSFSDHVWETFAAIRRVVVFLLGILIIADGLYGGGEDDNPIPLLVIGMVMVGVLPIDDLMPWGGRGERGGGGERRRRRRNGGGAEK